MADSLNLGNDINIFRGDDYVRTLTFSDEDEAAINITGWTIYFTGKVISSYTDDTSDTDAIIAVSAAISNGTAGEALLTVSSETTNTLTPDEYVYDLARDDGAGDIRTLVKGDLTIKADVTRRDS